MKRENLDKMIEEMPKTHSDGVTVTCKECFKSGASFASNILLPEIEKLKERNEMLSKLVTSQGIRDMEQLEEIEKLKAENQRFREALEFYADESKYVLIYRPKKSMDIEVVEDCGDKARQALSPQKKEGEL